MAFLKNIKQMFGFDDNSIYEDEKDNVNTEYKPYINPFKNEKQETANTAVAEDKKSEQTEADFDKAIHDEIKDKIIDIINASLPEFIKGCVDRDAELKYINEEFGTTFSTYTQNIRQAIEERAKSEWISERMNLEKRLQESGKKAEESTAKMEELRARITSLDRQKIALNERINQYENKVATAEAEREQYHLECKSLMNKLKVASVNEEEINKLREENTQMLQECTSLRNDIIMLRKEALNAKNNPATSAEDAEKMAALQQQLETANAEKVQLEQRITELENAAGNVPQPEIAQQLQAEIQKISDELYAAQVQLIEAQEKNQPLEQEVASLKESLAVAAHSSQETATALAAKDAEITLLKEQINQAGETAKLNDEFAVEFDQMKTDLAAAQQAVAESATVLSTKDSEIETLKAQLENANKTIAEKDAEAENIQELKALLQQADEINTKSSTQLSAKDSEIEALKAQLENANKAIAEKDAEAENIQELKALLQQADEINTKSSTQLSAKDSEIEALKAQLENANKAIAEKEAEAENIQELKALLQQADEINTKSSTQLSAKDSEIEALKAQLENANKAIAEKEAAVAEIEQLRLQFRQASDKASQSAAQLFAKTNEVDVLKAELKKLEEEKDSTESLKEEIEALKSERNIQWQKINEYTQALAAKDNEIESLSSSLNDTRNFANQLKGVIDNSNSIQKASEEKFLHEIERLRNHNEQLQSELDSHKEKQGVQVLFTDLEEVAPRKTAKKERSKKKDNMFSAIDYTTDYSDWLMETITTPTDVPIIPISSNEKEERPTDEPAKKKKEGPTQMELF
jgi:DNA repair exonuclease SbcCD ATPase subunit